MLLTIIALALSVSIDSFGIGITYGLRKTKLSTSAKFILFFVSFVFVCLSVLFGYILTAIFPNIIIKIISILLLIFMGTAIIHETNAKKQNHQISLKALGITIQIIKDPISSDLNNSKVIEKNEAIYLAIALSLDSICVGITSSSFGPSSLFFPILVPIFQFVFLNIGINLGKIITNSNNSFKKWNIISGILLIIIGILKIFT